MSRSQCLFTVYEVLHLLICDRDVMSCSVIDDHTHMPKPRLTSE